MSIEIKGKTVGQLGYNSHRSRRIFVGSWKEDRSSFNYRVRRMYGQVPKILWKCHQVDGSYIPFLW